ncbi:hypothetical protein Dimus_004481 [Dionaea muscipula]
MVKYCKLVSEVISGKPPLKLLLPRSRYRRLVQLLRELDTAPEMELKPRASVWRDGRWRHIESRGRVPVSCWLARLMSVTEPAELHVMPVKLQGEFVETQEEKRAGLVELREDLRLRSDWSSEDVAEAVAAAVQTTVTR